jgi:DNA-binding CsgD family transcriptional regulator
VSTTTGLDWPLVGRSSDLQRVTAAFDEPSVRVVHVVGDPGTGKSRLAQEALVGAELDGFPVAHLTATASAATVPLSILGPLLPPSADQADPATLLDRVAAHVRDLADGSRMVVHVDDVDLLDAVSCTLLARLWQEGVVLVVATQRLGTPAPDVLLAESRRGGVRRLDLADLPRSSVATLLHHVLRGPVSASAEHALWTASGGNPLFLRELVTGAVLGGRLAESDGVWVLDGGLDVTGGLAGLVADRLGHLDATSRELVDLLALCGPLGVDELATAYPLDALEQLEAGGVITVTVDRRRQEVALAHPVYVQVVRDELPRLKARRLLMDQLARSESYGSRRRGDALRQAVWRLDATGTADASLLVEGAQLARGAHDYALVERLASAALLLEPDVRASTLLGEALYEQGRFAEADQVLSSADSALGEGAVADDVVRLGLIHGIVLFFGLGRGPEALDRLGRAADQVAALPISDELRVELTRSIDSMRALLASQGGRSAEALTMLPAEPPAEREMAAVHARAEGWARYRTGDAAGALEVALAAWERESGTDDAEGLLHPADDLMVAALASLELGRPTEARELAARGRDVSVEQGVGFQAAWLAWAVATIDLITGYAEDAAGAFRELVATASRSGFGQVERLASLGMVECCALTGDATGAHEWMARAESLPPAAPAFALHSTLASAWLAAVDGDTRTAIALVVAHGDELVARGELREAVVLLDEAVLFGDPPAAARMLAVVDAVDTPVGRARGLRARALLSGDPADLLAAAEEFAACGFVHSAAVQAAQAARTLRASGQARAAAAAEAKAKAYADQSPGLQVEGLGSAAGAALLTPREREIALLAARGRTSKEVAADLVLSVRTVDNHLANVYAKLGVPGRAELAGALALAEPEAPVVPRPRTGRQT